MKRRHRSTYVSSPVQYTACHECDWLMLVPPLQPGEQAVCPRCEHKLSALPTEARLQPLVYSIAALIMLLCSNLFPFLGMAVKGMHQDMTLYQTATTLLEEQHPTLALTVYLFMQILPAICLLLICLIYSRLGQWRGKRLRKRYTLWLFRLIPWCMVEVFLIGVLVSLIKIASLADIELGYSFWAYVLFSLLMLKAFSVIDRDWLWWQQSGPIHLRQAPQPTGRAIDQNLTLCHAWFARGFPDDAGARRIMAPAVAPPCLFAGQYLSVWAGGRCGWPERPWSRLAAAIWRNGPSGSGRLSGRAGTPASCRCWQPG